MTGINVLTVDDDTLEIEDLKGEKRVLSTAIILLATNAFVEELVALPIEVTPGRGQVVITSPLKTLPLEIACHMREGYDYARPVIDQAGNKRLLLGGGRISF